MPKHFNFGSIENFRDIGGYFSSYGETSFNLFYRSASLSNASESDLRAIDRLGIKSVIDLREKLAKEKYPDKTKANPRITTYELDVNGNGRIPTDRDDQVDSYFEMLEEPYTARRIILSMCHAPKPLIIHCTAGKDRTGVFVGLLLLANGVSMEDVNADYMASFPYLSQLKANALKNDQNISPVVLEPQTELFPRFWKEFFDKYETIENYFEFIGLSDETYCLFANLLGSQEKSCGVALFKGNKVLVEHMGLGHFSLPKGHVESYDEDEVATARREVLEEIGLTIDINESKSKFIDYSPKRGAVKNVKFFLAKYVSGEIACQAEEVTAAYWLDIDDALRTLTFETDRSIVRWAAVETGLRKIGC